MLLAVTFRPDFQVPWAGHAGVTLITLSRLDRTEGVHLAGLLAPELPPMLLDRIALRGRRRAAVHRGTDQGLDGTRA